LTANSLQNPAQKCLKNLQKKFKEIKLLVIDEFGMIGKNLIYALDTSHWKTRVED
jgi:hypothetical protein